MSNEEVVHLKSPNNETNDMKCTSLNTDNETELISAAETAANKNCRLIVILLVVICMIIIIVIVIIFIFVTYPLISSEPDETITIGLSGEWPCHGGNSKRQQIANSQTTLIDSSILYRFGNSSYSICNISAGINPMPWRGYVSIDNKYRGYFTSDNELEPGFVTCFDLNTCHIIWRVSILETLQNDESFNDIDIASYQWGMRQTVTLFTNSNGIKGVLVGTPNKGNMFEGGNENKLLCMAVAFNADSGDLLWKTKLSEGFGDRGCNAHGFLIPPNSKYAFGGLSYSRPPLQSTFRGRMFKIDIDTGEIIDIWWSIPKNKTDQTMSTNYTYLGAASWFFPSLIDEYLVFGTGNLYSAPKYIDECMSGNFSALPIENSYHIDPCGNNMSDNFWWRCLEKNIYTDSFIILNQTDFNVIAAKPLQGIDSWNGPFCYLDELRPPCLKKPGPDGDLSVVVTYHSNGNGQLYAAAAQKTGHFYVFEIPSAKLIISKKLSPASTWGGGRYGLAVDEVNMIAVVSITGGGLSLRGDAYKYYLADGTLLCSITGSSHAIDLNTGNTIWQITTPYGHINEYNSTECVEDTEDYVDIAINQSCILNNDSWNVLNDNINVVIAPKTMQQDNDYNVIYDDIERGRMSSPITISKDLVFIPVASGHIFIHSLFTGKYYQTISCPLYYNEGNDEWRRGIVSGGITIVRDHILFYCYTSSDTQGGYFMNIKLDL